MASTPGIFCNSCDYDLKALPAGRCPECGQEFDPTDSATFATMPGYERDRWMPGKELVWCSVLPGMGVATCAMLKWLSSKLPGHSDVSSIIDGVFIAISMIALVVGVTAFALLLLVIPSLLTAWFGGLLVNNSNHRQLARALVSAGIAGTTLLLAVVLAMIVDP